MVDAAQYPSLLNQYASRPSWQVAGVDYHVGAPSGTALKDPATISMAGVSVDTSTRTVNITGNNVTLDGYDFSLHGGYQVYVSGANTTIRNSNFALGTNTGAYLISGGPSALNLTVEYCTMDASTIGNQTSLIGYTGSGAITLRYNWFKNFPQHVLELAQGSGKEFSVVYKYNLIEQGAIAAGAHLNYLQFGGGHATSVDVEYNTTYQTHQVAGGEGFQFYNNSSGGIIDNSILAYNMMIAKGSGGGDAMSYLIHGGGTTGSVHDNYFDITGAYGAFYGGSFNGWSSFSNNINMVTSNIINANNSEVPASGSTPTIPPNVDTPIIAAFSADSNVAGDGITNDNALRLYGSAPANSTVRVYDKGTQIGSTTADSSGAWNYSTGTVADGTHSFTASATSGGTTSAISSALLVTVDTVAPPAASITNGTINENKLVTLTGTAEGNSTVKVFEGATQIGTVAANASGAWSYTTGTLSDGAHNFTAQAMDAAGNTGAASAALAVAVGTSAPNDTTPPVLTSFSPADNSTGVAPSSNIVLTFSETVVPGSGNTVVPGSGNIVIRNSNGTIAKSIAVTDTSQVTFSGNQVTINPSSDLAAASGYYVNIASGVIRDVAGNSYAGISNSTSFNFTTDAPVSGGGGSTPVTSLFSASSTPPQTYNDGQQLEVGVQFKSSVAGEITALKFYRSPSDTGSDVLDLWTATGTKLASATFTNTAASGWQTVALSTPVAIAANTNYIVSYHTTGAYVATNNFFTTDLTSGVLTAPSTTTVGGNGVYSYGGTSSIGIFPTNTWTATNYWADVVFEASAAPVGVDTTAPTVISVVASPSTATLTTGNTVTLKVNFSEMVTVSSGGQPTLTLNDGGTANYVSGAGSEALTFSYAVSAGQNTADLAVTRLNPNGATIRDAAGNNAVLSGAATNPAGTLAIDTTVLTSLFSASSTPPQTYNDGQQLEVGVQFKSSIAGEITALKFYRSPSDTGSDVLDLWTATGTKLASATFTNTAASGWQTVALSTPVAITANTNYIVSYHTTGAYVATNNFFTTDLTSGVLTAPSTTTVGGNGVYSYGGTSSTGIFPTNTWTATNYWADVVFASNIIEPAGVAGEAINLGLTNPPDRLGFISADISGVPSSWTLNAGTEIGDGTWTVQTNDLAALSVTSPKSNTGALVLNVEESWVNADGSSGNAVFADNVEVYAEGAPIFAISGDDNLSGSSGDDLFVLAQPIGNDTIYKFDVAHDKVNLIGFSGLSGFVDVQTRLSENSNGDAVVTIAEGESITFNGVSAASLTANNFVFNRNTVMDNANSIVIGDNAVLPLAGTVNNSGTIELASNGGQTRLQVLANGLTLEGGGHVDFSDSNSNIIVGTTPDATLTNVDNTISGAGQLGEGQLRLHNEGTIIASGGNALTIDTAANAIVNSGTLEAVGSGGLDIHSDIANFGLLWANGGSIAIDGDVSGTGSALINGAALFEVGGAFGQNFKLDADANATLKIDHAADFSGTVAGFDANDALDVADLAFDGNTTLSYAANSSNTGGTLTVSDGTHTANIALLGQYMAADFVMSADGFGGTLIHDSPPATLTQTLTHPQHACR